MAGREFRIHTDDTFIVSYPRSGNTWIRFLIANLLFPQQDVSFATIERQIPDAEALSSKRLRRVPRPRFIKSHQYFNPRYKKVVYIVRDPRDVVLSYYDFERKYRHIDDAYPLASFVSDFVDGRLTSADWGTWRENVGTWIYTRGGTSNFLLLRYEDIRSDTPAQIIRLAEFLGLEPSAELVEQAIAKSDASRMRELERTESSRWVSTKGKRDDIPFIRTATTGGWRTELPESAATEIERAWGPLMTTLGYGLFTERGQEFHESSQASAFVNVSAAQFHKLVERS